MKTVMVTGNAGFIGSHLTEKLLDMGYRVIGVDNLYPYYNISIKMSNMEKACKNPNFIYYQEDILSEDLYRILDTYRIDYVIHLAACVGVRDSYLTPLNYIDVNVKGTTKLLEYFKDKKLIKFIFASSSSVYSYLNEVPFTEGDDFSPISIYGATKLQGEIICKAYHLSYDMNIIALRFFTVYGPRQRPDMAIHKFIRMIKNGEEIPIYGDGESFRDYTFVLDTVDGIVRAMNFQDNRYNVFNLGRGKIVILNDLIQIIKEEVDEEVKEHYMEFQLGDMPATFANIEKARNAFGYSPKISIREGIREFIKWYKTKES